MKTDKRKLTWWFKYYMTNRIIPSVMENLDIKPKYHNIETYYEIVEQLVGTYLEDL